MGIGDWRSESISDAEAAQLERAGLASGMRVLDAGAGVGLGATARFMAKRVGDSGCVVAIDSMSARLSAAHRPGEGATNLHYAVANLERLPFRDGSFDLVWSRYAFACLRDPSAAIAELVRVLRPGGTLAVADLDGNGLFQYPIPLAIERAFDRLVEAMAGRCDPFAGRKLFHRFCRVGLQNLKVEALPHSLCAGSASQELLAQWEQKLEMLSEIGIGLLGRPGYDVFRTGFLRLLRDPETFSYSTLIQVTGEKPT